MGVSLSKILKKENTIILPEFGAILKIGEGFQFNKFLKYNDGKLITFVKEEYGIDDSAAKEKVSLFIKEIKNQLDEKGTYEIVGVGLLKLKGESISIIKIANSLSSEIEKEKVSEKPKEVSKTSESVIKKEEKKIDTPKKVTPDNKEAKKEAAPIVKKEPTTSSESKETDKGKEEVKPSKDASKTETKNIKENKLDDNKPKQPPIVNKVDKTKEGVSQKVSKEEVKKEKPEKTAAKKASKPSKPVKEAEDKTITKVGKEDPILKEESKRKKRVPLFLIVLLLIILILGGTGFFFKSYFTGYYHSVKTYITGNNNSESIKGLTADGSKHHKAKEHKESKKASKISVSENEIASAEEEYVGDSKVEGATEKEKQLANNIEEPKTIEVTSEEKETEVIEEGNVSNDSALISQLNSKIEDLKNQLADSNQQNKESNALISDLQHQITSLENKLRNQPNASSVNKTNASNGRYKVIVGSFSERSHAESKTSDLKSNGYNNSNVVGKYGGFYIVSIGGFDSKSDAESLKTKYKSSGGSVFIKKI